MNEYKKMWLPIIGIYHAFNYPCFIVFYLPWILYQLTSVVMALIIII